MKTRDIITYNGKEWKVIAIKGDYIRIRLVGKRGAEKIVKITDVTRKGE